MSYMSHPSVAHSTHVHSVTRSTHVVGMAHMPSGLSMLRCFLNPFLTLFLRQQIRELLTLGSRHCEL